MKCSKCQHGNPEDAKFCNECGHKLELACPKCGKVNPPGSKFCNGCGHNLSQSLEPIQKDLSFDEKIEKIQRYLPGGLTEKILAQRGKIEGERKQVTVMFCDLEGFTPLVEKLGPEEAYTVMDQVYETLIHQVHDYEGTVNEMTGDGILALFGAPIALEDAPQRAIRSAYAIHQEISKFSDKAKQQIKGLPRLKMRIGVHTGPVVVGTVGNDLRVDFKAVGDTVNLASRMEGLAEPGSTYVTEQTFRLTDGIFTFEALGERQVKGKEGPVKVYRVIAPSTQRTRFDVSTERGLTPLVGRDRELELLMDGFKRCKESRGQAFSIVAEAGVGKSRLLYEFIKSIAKNDVTILEGKCLSFSRGVAYHPIIDLFKSNFDIKENDEKDQIRDKVQQGLKQLNLDEASTLPLLLELLSAKENDIDEISMSPEARKDMIVETITRIPLKASERRPLIMVVEDLHWIDKSSEDALKAMLEKISGEKILLIFTYRSEFVHIWGGKSYHNQLTLNRLSNRESLAMVTHLLGVRTIERNLEEVIIEKTEGIPLFIEEFVKSLQDIQAIEKRGDGYQLTKNIRDMTIPSTIQDVIMARVDSLSDGAKMVLQKGAVIEREFSHALIKRVVNLPDQELLSLLSVLKDSELLFERGIYPECTYIFKHALTREVVYDSILKKRKMQLHRNIGNAIEELYPNRLDEFYEILAHHYSKSESYEKAHRYLKLSGNKALKNYSTLEAIFYYEEAIKALENMPETKENEKEIVGLRLSMSGPMVFSNWPEGSLENLRNGAKLSEELGDEKSLTHFLSLMGLFYAWKKGDLRLGIKYSSDSFEKAESIDNLELMAPIGGDLCLQYWWAGECRSAVDLGAKVIVLLEKTQRQFESFGRPYNLYAAILAWCANSNAMLGDFKKAEVMLKKSFDFAYKIEDLRALAVLELQNGFAFNYKGEAEKAIEHLQTLIRYCEEGQLYLFGPAWGCLAWSHLLLGDIKTSREFIEKCLKYYKRAENQIDLGLFHWLLGMVHFESRDFEKATSVTEEALKLSQKMYQKHLEAFAWILLGRIFGMIGSPQISEAEGCILKGINILKGLKLRALYAPGYHYLGELYADIGQKAEARENLKKAEGLFQKMGMDYWITKTHDVLAKYQIS